MRVHCVYTHKGVSHGETWAPTVKEFQDIETIQRKMLMMILNIHDADRVSYVDILDRTKMVCIESHIRKQRLKNGREIL